LKILVFNGIRRLTHLQQVHKSTLVNSLDLGCYYHGPIVCHHHPRWDHAVNVLVDAARNLFDDPT
jgi:hypothetical protein